MAAEPEPYKPATWRLLDTGWLDGASNMAIDEALMQGVAGGQSPSTLRFYGWDPPCLSLGYAQKLTVADLDACAAHGWDVVRRPTGGRAILHIDELTYSVCVSDDDPRVRGGLLASYRRLSDALAAGLEALGLDVQRAQPAGNGRPDEGPACFDNPSNFEITAGGCKLVGSAQARKYNVVLQHGTLPLYGDITRIAGSLQAGEQKREQIRQRLRQSATTLEAAAGRRISYAVAAQSIAAGFGAMLNLDLQPGELNGWEQEQVARIRAEKYGNPAWSNRL